MIGSINANTSLETKKWVDISKKKIFIPRYDHHLFLFSRGYSDKNAPYPDKVSLKTYILTILHYIYSVALIVVLIVNIVILSKVIVQVVVLAVVIWKIVLVVCLSIEEKKTEKRRKKMEEETFKNMKL